MAMRTLLAILALTFALAACGIKGDPEAPDAGPSEQTE
jgi:predicted small lipoprotein YifL